MEMIIKGEAKEIAALVLAIQERQTEDPFVELTEKLHAELNRQAKEARSAQESL